MDPADSLRQTVTNLFDAVKHSEHAKELEKEAADLEGTLETELSKLDSRTEEILNLTSGMREDSDEAVEELTKQLESFLSAAVAQAKQKLKRKAKEEVAERQAAAAGERDKALKSMEAYLATDPIPVIEQVVSVKLGDGIYQAHSRYECEGGIKYDFRLAAQNSKLFHQELMLSQLGYDLKVPVRFSKALLKKSRVLGFERLDQYVLTDAETSGEKVRAHFQKADNGARIKMTTSVSEDAGFVGLEYCDQVHAVNVMNDPTLSAHADLNGLKRAASDLSRELSELSKKKVALLKLSFNGDADFEELDCYKVLESVLKVLGPAYRTVLKEIASAPRAAGRLSHEVVRERLRILGERSPSVAQALGVQTPQ
ncbi:MAG: hypothetical protein HY247_04390 [archaeon]|nr:MAG: hypothetical protein HY247_04390 [archaeon]